MRRRILLRCSPGDREQAGILRTKWIDALNITLDEEDSQPHVTVSHEPEVEAAGSIPKAKPRVSILLIGTETASDISLMARVTSGLANGDCVIGIRLAPELAVPTALYAAGSEILDCDSEELSHACDRATLAVRRAPAIVAAANSATAGEDECARAPTAVVQSDPVPIPE